MARPLQLQAVRVTDDFPPVTHSVYKHRFTATDIEINSSLQHVKEINMLPCHVSNICNDQMLGLLSLLQQHFPSIDNVGEVQLVQ